MPILLRADYDALQVRTAAKTAKDGSQVRRLLALAAIYDGGTRNEAARIGGVTLQIVRDWVMRFNAHGPDGLIDRKVPGRPARLNDMHRAAVGSHDRERADTGHSWRGALAADRSLPVAVGRAPGHCRQANSWPRAAGHELPQAFCPPAPPHPGKGSHRAF